MKRIWLKNFFKANNKKNLHFDLNNEENHLISTFCSKNYKSRKTNI